MRFLFFSFFLSEKTAAGCPCQGGKGIPIVGIPGDKSRHENQRVKREMGSFLLEVEGRQINIDLSGRN